jgi:hypothetical protein
LAPDEATAVFGVVGRRATAAGDVHPCIPGKSEERRASSPRSMTRRASWSFGGAEVAAGRTTWS